MDLDYMQTLRAQLEVEWPNHKSVLEQWLPKSKVMVHATTDVKLLDTLVSRLPEEWLSAPRVTIRDWFFLPEEDKQQHVDKNLILIYEYVPGGPIGIPGLFLFLPQSVMFEKDGKFQDLRDQTGWKWGDQEKRILSDEILNNFRHAEIK